MLGNVENEARFYVNPLGRYDWPLVERMTALLASRRQVQVMERLHASKLNPYEAPDHLITTTCFTEPAMQVMRDLASAGFRTNCHHFRRSSPGATRSNLRAWHSAEIRYIFGNLLRDGYYDLTDVAISDQMQRGWVSFASSGIARDRLNGIWPRYNNDTRRATISTTASPSIVCRKHI